MGENTYDGNHERRQAVGDTITVYLAYFISGMVILIFGVILPNLIEERNLSFTAAGGLLSFLAIGNLCSSLVYPVFCG